MFVFSHHSPLLGVIEPLQQLNGGALSTAATADQGKSLSLLHLQAQPLQDGNVGPRRVVEADIGELHVSVIFILQGRGEVCGLSKRPGGVSGPNERMLCV